MGMVVDPISSPDVLKNGLPLRIDDRAVFTKQHPHPIEKVIVDIIHD